jgi:aspartate kinase
MPGHFPLEIIYLQWGNSMLVYKYGGTSVGTVERIQRVAVQIARTHRTGEPLVVVVSAMGQETDELLKKALALHSSPPKRELDMLLSAGERISTALLSIALHKLQVPSLSLTGSQCGILTDGTHGNARIRAITGERIQGGLSKGHVVIVAGFQGVCQETKEITTLGRGGSDLTAVALAVRFKARYCAIFTDVPGVMTGDPRLIPGAVPIPRLPWETLQEMAWAGAGVMHTRAAHLAHKHRVEVHIRSSLAPDHPGTVVGETVEEERFTSLVLKKSQCFFQINFEQISRSLWTKALLWLWEKEESPSFWQYTEKNGMHWQGVMQDILWNGFLEWLKGESQEVPSIQKEERLAMIGIVGMGFRQNPEVMVKLNGLLGPSLLKWDLEDRMIRLLVPEEESQTLGLSLHQAFLS